MIKPRAQLAALLCALAVVAATAASAAADDAAAGGGAVFSDPPVSAPAGAFARRAAALVGHFAAPGAQVSVDAKLGDAPWAPVGTATTDADGGFSLSWTPPRSGRFDFRITPAGATAAADQQPLLGALSVYRRQKATWYGPGFYGKRTACGVRLTRRTLGVAHRSLPCGSNVELFSAGRTVTVPVIDRGPYVRGVTWDLTYATARALGTPGTVVLGALPTG